MRQLENQRSRAPEPQSMRTHLFGVSSGEDRVHRLGLRWARDERLYADCRVAITANGGEYM
jgi:hypothetical protein